MYNWCYRWHSQEVGGIQNKTDFYCRKQYYALNAQVIKKINRREEPLLGQSSKSVRNRKTREFPESGECGECIFFTIQAVSNTVNATIKY